MSGLVLILLQALPSLWVCAGRALWVPGVDVAGSLLVCCDFEKSW